MTETTTERGLDIDILELLDFEHEEVCETEECSAPAEYQIRTACCGYMVLICENCLLDCKEWLRKTKHQQKECVKCGWKGHAGPEWFIVMGRI